LNQCLKDFQGIDFKLFEKKIKMPYVEKLHQIYGFLSQYNQIEYLSYRSKLDFCIFINENS
jgi:hypothetical protein